MRLPGTRYQEPGWERVRKLLGAASLTVLQTVQWPRLHSEPMLDWYCQAMAVALQQSAGSARAQAAGNSYGETALELAQSLVCELRVLPTFWHAFIQTLPAQASALPTSPESPTSSASPTSPTSPTSTESTDHRGAWLRKKINDMYVGLRDRVDADQYQIATGRPCSANKIYTYRMLDTAWHEISNLLADWQNHCAQLSIILNRPMTVQPIESRRVRSAADCDPDWIIRWSASVQEFGRGIGPLHTRSKRFSSLKNNPETIRRMLTDMAEYEAISHHATDQWHSDDVRFDDWAEDYWRVVNESETHQAAQTASAPLSAADSRQGTSLPAVDRAFQFGTAIEHFNELNIDESASEDPEFDSKIEQEFDDSAQFLLEESEQAADTANNEARIMTALQAEGLLDENTVHRETSPHTLPDAALAEQLALPPDYIRMASASEDRDSLMYRALQQESLAVRLALYSKQLGAWDDCYPETWLDPATGELPSMKQLAALDQISLPTLRKRRDLALQRLQAAREQCNRG